MIKEKTITINNKDISSEANMLYFSLLCSDWSNPEIVKKNVKYYLENDKYGKEFVYALIVELLDRGYFGLCFKDINGKLIAFSKGGIVCNL